MTAKRKPTHGERVALIKALLAHAVAQHAMLQNAAHHSDAPPGAPPGPAAAPMPTPMPMPPPDAMAGPPPAASGAFPFGQPPAGRMH